MSMDGDLERPPVNTLRIRGEAWAWAVKSSIKA